MSEAILTKSRQYKRKVVTELFNKRSEFENWSDEERSATKSKLLGLSSDLKELNTKLQSVKWSTDDPDEFSLNREFEICNEYDDKIYSALSLLEVKAVESESNSRSKFKIPEIPLPKFSGKENEDLLKFFHEFEQSVRRYSLSDYDKFILLKQNLTGRARVLVDSLETTNHGYVKAKKLLEQALASGEIQIFNTIKQLSSLKLGNNDDPFVFVSKIKNLMEAIKKLKITVDHFIQYFYWNGLPPAFQNQLIMITNHTRPTLTEIDSNFFDACERFTNFKKFETKNNEGKKDESVHSLAANIVNSDDRSLKFKTKPCLLCGTSADHPIFKCSVFITPKDKLSKLKSLGGCFKCGHVNHRIDECKAKLKSKCRTCDAWHMTYLCNKDVFDKTPSPTVNCTPEKTTTVNSNSKTNVNSKVKTNAKTKNAKVGDDKVTTNGITVTDTVNSEVDSKDNSILPTFTFSIDGNEFRGLKDGGAQSNFISSSLADSLNLEVIKPNVNLLVKGINSVKRYETKMVRFEICLGKTFYEISALCLPEIDISLDLPKLQSVVTGFIDKGYTLADSNLVNCVDKISGVDFILGTKSGYCLPESEKLFGQDSLSIYSETSIGILLKGDIFTLNNNIEFLPLCNFNSIAMPSKSIFTNNDKFSVNCENEIETTALFINDRNYNVLDDLGNVIDSELKRASDDALASKCKYYTNYDDLNYQENSVELNDKLVNYVLNNTVLENDGRLRMPLLWNPKVAHKLSCNFNLSKSILHSVYNKIKNDETKLTLLQNTFKEQESLGIIERIENLEGFMNEHPECSFLPFMCIYKLSRDTTKCRPVFLSNLKEKSKDFAVSHNQAIYAGPPLNQKLSSAILHLRFGKFLLAFDLVKAFNQISLSEVDQNRLIFLWYRNVSKGDLTLIGYRNLRLSFGLRCSPTILMIGLYIILMQNTENDDFKLINFKKLLYQLAYMDNIGFVADSEDELFWGSNQLEGIFSSYKFGLQQFISNHSKLHADFNPDENENDTVKKLLGMQWNLSNDTIFTNELKLNIEASSKREILSSIASHFDVFGYNLPLLNRARLFLHKLQCCNSLGWDDKLNDDDLKSWKNICNQINSSQPMKVSRSVGKRNDLYNLIAFADASKDIYGTVVYLQNVNDNEVYFVSAKNRIVNKQLEVKSIPSLELQAVTLATECLLDLFNELSGKLCVCPINIDKLYVYSDSLVALNWLNSYTALEKMQKKTVFVQNRLKRITDLCANKPVTFRFVSGIDNPADLVTRPVSYKLLSKSNYINGPSFLNNFDIDRISKDDILNVTIPNINCKTNNVFLSSVFNANVSELVDVKKYSSFNKVVKILKNVMLFVNKLKLKIKSKRETTFKVFDSDHNFHVESVRSLILEDQKEHFPEVFEFFDSKVKQVKDIPNVVSQLNVYVDKFGLLRVKNKGGSHSKNDFPLLLSKKSLIAQMIVRDLHEKLAHAGIYTVLNEIRRRFWITHIFSVVKKILNQCIFCKRFHARTIRLNQSQYRQMRLKPENVPYRNIYMDFMGPFKIKHDKSVSKVWVLVLTCMWSRAVNLKICNDLSTKEFLMAFQKHIFEFGLPTHCISDMGSQLTSGANVIKTFLDNHEVIEYFQENGVEPLKFEHFFKGHSQLGSIVESCVKLTKKLIYGAIGKNVLNFNYFDYIICQTIHLVNKRPISFKEALRDTSGKEVPEVITPEMLTKGYELLSLNIIPELNHSDEWQENDLKSGYEQLVKVREKLIKCYNEEFITTLIKQAVDKKDRYKPCLHHEIKPKDIVLIKDPFLKPANYPMAIVHSVVKNSNGEVTGATIMKGKTREVIKRHSSTLIPLLQYEDDSDETESCDSENKTMLISRPRSVRKAARESRMKTRNILLNE